MEKTPIMLLIEKLEKDRDYSLPMKKHLKKIATELLETEKKVICEAYSQGYRDAESDEGFNKGDISEYDDANLYYNNKFNK